MSDTAEGRNPASGTTPWKHAAVGQPHAIFVDPYCIATVMSQLLLRSRGRPLLKAKSRAVRIAHMLLCLII